MSADLAGGLDRLRRRIRGARTLAGAVRGTFYASLALCLLLVLLKIFSKEDAFLMPLTGAAGVLILLSGAIPLLRRFSRMDCAILLDRRFELQERLASALTVEGSMAEAVRRDAERVWTSFDPAKALPSLPIEAKGLPVTLGLLVLLLLAPSPGSGGGTLDPELAASVRMAAEKLRQSGAEDLAQMAAALDSATTAEEVSNILAELRRAEEAALTPGGGAGGENRQASAAASGAILSAALQRQGDLPRTLSTLPASLERKLRSSPEGVGGGWQGSPSGGTGKEGGGEGGGVDALSLPESDTRRGYSGEIPSGYEAIVAAYFEVKR